MRSIERRTAARCLGQLRDEFGEISDGWVQPSELGRAVTEEWLRGPEMRKEIRLDEFVLMPNHFHGLLLHIPLPGQAATDIDGEFSVPKIINQFKGTVSRRPSSELGIRPVWQERTQAPLAHT